MCHYSHWSPVSCACYGNSKNKPNSSWEGPIFPFYGKHSFILVQKKDNWKQHVTKATKCFIIKSSYTFSSYMYACNHCLWNYYYNLWNGQIGVVSFPSVWGWQPCQCFLLARWGQQCAGETQNAQRSWSERNSNKPVGLDCAQVLVTGAFKKLFFAI